MQAFLGDTPASEVCSPVTFEYIKVKGQWRYLYRAVDKHGQTMGGHFSAGRAGIATKMRDALGFLRQGFQRRPMRDALPSRPQTPP